METYQRLLAGIVQLCPAGHEARRKQLPRHDWLHLHAIEGTGSSNCCHSETNPGVSAMSTSSCGTLQSGSNIGPEESNHLRQRCCCTQSWGRRLA